jgi:hypothetical protein
MINPYNTPASMIKAKPKSGVKEAREILDNLLKDFYAKPKFTLEERRIVWQLSMAADALKRK